MKKLFRRCSRRVLTPVMSKKYNAQEGKRLSHLYKKILPLLLIITLMIGFLNFFYNSTEQLKVQTAIVFSILVGVQIMHYFAIKFKPDYFNIWQQVSVLIQHLILMKYILDYASHAKQLTANNLYFMGYSLGILFYIFLTGTNQFVKVTLLCSVFIEILIYIGLSEDKLPAAVLVMMGITCLIASIKIIQEERRKQRLFLTNESNQIWQKVIEKFLPINILMVEYDQNNQRIVLNSSNLFTKQNLNIYSDDDLQIFLDMACVHSPQKNQQNDIKINNTENLNDTEQDKNNQRSDLKKLSSKIDSQIRDYSFSLSPLKRKSSSSRRKSLLQINKINGLQRGQRSQTIIQQKNPHISIDKKSRLSSNYREKKNLKHHLKEFMIKATKDRNLSRQVYELKIEYEQDNDVKLFQLKIMPFFFDQNYAIITIDNLSNEERLKNKDDLLQVSNHLNNHCRQRVIANTEQIIKNFIQVQNEAIQNFESSDFANTKSIFSILQASTFQMCQRTINQVKNIQTLSYSKKKISILSQRFSLIEQIRNILKRFSYQLHKNNQKFKLFIDTTQSSEQQKLMRASQGAIEKPSYYSNSMTTNINNHTPQNNINSQNNSIQNTHPVNQADESIQTFSISKQASQSHLAVFSQISQVDIQKSPRNGGRSSFYSNTPPINNQLKNQTFSNYNNAQTTHQYLNQHTNNTQPDFQQQIVNQTLTQQEYLKYFNISEKQINDSISQPLNLQAQEFQQSSALQQIFLGMRQEEIINEENEKNEEASIQNSVNQSEKLMNNDSPNSNHQKMIESLKKTPTGSKQLYDLSSQSLNNTQSLRQNFKKTDSQIVTPKSQNKPDESTQLSQSIDIINIDENSKNYLLLNQKNQILSQFRQNSQQNFINNIEGYNMQEKFKFQSLKHPYENQISPPNSLLCQIQQSPLNSFIHNYSYDRILNSSELQNLNLSKHFNHHIMNLDECSQDVIPIEGNEYKANGQENSLVFKMREKSSQTIVNFPKKNNLVKQQDPEPDFIDMNQTDPSLLSPLKQNTKKQSDKSNCLSEFHCSRSSLQPSLVSNGLNNDDILQTSSSSSSSQCSSPSQFSSSPSISSHSDKSIESSTVNQSNISCSQDSKAIQKSVKKRIKKRVISDSKKIFKNKRLSKIGKNEIKISEYKIRKYQLKQRGSKVKSPKNYQSATSISNEIPRDQFEGNTIEDIIIYQDIGKVNNILYNFIENSIIHGKQNSEIFMRIIENPPQIVGESEQSYLTIEITNSSLQEIEDAKNKIESSQEYYFHDQDIIHQIMDDENNFCIGLRASRKNLRYLGPFDQINFSYDFPKSKIKCSFSIYKNIEILYPELPQMSPTRSMLSPQTNSLYQSNHIHLSPIASYNYQQADSTLQSHGIFTYKNQSQFHSSSVEKYKLVNSFNFSPQTVKKGKLSKEIAQMQGGSPGLSNIYNGSAQQLQRKRNSLIIQKDLNQSTSIHNKLKGNLHQIQQTNNNYNKGQSLDLSINFVNRFRNNSIYNESSSKQLSKESSQQVPSVMPIVSTQKEILNLSVRQNRVSSCQFQGDNICQSIQINTNSLQFPKNNQANAIFNKISLFNNRTQQDEHFNQSQNFEQELMLKEKQDSFQTYNDEAKHRIDTNNQSSNRNIYLPGNRVSNNTIPHQVSYLTAQSNSTSINNAKNNCGGIMIESNSIKLDQKASILVKSNNQYIGINAQLSPSTSKNRSQKAFTFFP